MLPPETSATLVTEVRLGQDELAKAIRERPEKVLASVVEMCDHFDELASRVLSIPLGTQTGVIEATLLQGKALALQTFLGTFFDKLTEKDDLDENLQSGNS